MISNRKQYIHISNTSNELMYLVKWKGYDNSYNMWLPKNTLGNAKQILREYRVCK